MSSQGTLKPVHVALLPSAGMGHLTPFSRLAVSLSEICQVTLVSILPTVSSAEAQCYSDLFSSYPQIHPLHFHLPPVDTSTYPNTDPFFLRWELIGKSAPELFNKLLSNSSVPISALIIDTSIASSVIPLAKNIGIPCYVLFTSSASMLSFFTYFPTYYESNPTRITDVDIPGLRTVPVASVPRPLHDPKDVFTKLLIQNGRDMSKADGVLVNTSLFFEPDSLAWLSKLDFPPVFGIGPLKPAKNQVDSNRLPGEHSSSTVFTWLDKQASKSVLFVNFGSRTAMAKEQVRELGLGLESSGLQFIWVVKTKIVDKEDETKIEELLGEGYLERVQDRGLVVKGWVEQEKVLGHNAIGGFLSHCGWNSLTEALMNGVRVLAWPRIGDQRVNADLVVRCGLGVWEKDWSWEGEKGIVNAAQISEKVKELMNNESLMNAARIIGEKALMATRIGGSSYEALVEFAQKLKCSN